MLLKFKWCIHDANLKASKHGTLSEINANFLV